MTISQFPLVIDSFKVLQDYPASVVPDIEEYKMLKQKSSLTSSEQIRLNELLIKLNPYMITVDDYNLIVSAIKNIEDFQKNSIDGYIQTKQNEFNATLQKFSSKGLYDSATTYQQWNIVTFNYETYMSLKDDNLNHTPDNNPNWWQKISYRGAQGQPGIGLVMCGVYNNTTTYYANQAVNYNGSIYYALQTTTGNTPSISSQYWALFQANVAPIIQDSPPSNIINGQVWIQTGI